ncbi:O-antigen ligase family protein [Flagellimonas myxillae]|uniref:O-antigen ligase family protein n=1 Tax=Flagellimonas myxillae TaxID=2942214 RepID=UPI00201ED213|nr:O-antigen ligase family protein [Muricauda myxillae]MCL6266671.1 O-antigen ligase family protein [Muricauda myxillae]
MLRANLIVLIFLFVLAATFHQALYFLIPAITLFFISKQRQSRISLSPLVKLYLLIVTVAIVFFVIQSIMNMNVALFSIKGIARYVCYLLFASYVLTAKIEDVRDFFKVIIIFFVITFPLGIYQVWAVDRYQGIFNHANHFAYILCFCIYFLVFHKPFKTKWLGNLCLLVLFLSIILTKSSGGMLVLLTLLAYNVARSKRISLNKKLLLLFSFLGITTLVLFSSEKVTSQLDSINYLNWEFLKERVEQFKVGGYGSVVWRVIYWIKILFSFYEESWGRIIFGVGVDTMTEGNMPYPYMYKDPHNDFLKILVEFGLAGLFLFLFYFRKIYKIVNKNFKIIILIIIPIFFGNAIVNFVFNITLLLLLAYEYRFYYIQNDQRSIAAVH